MHRLFKEENEIWSQLYSKCREAQMFPLFPPIPRPPKPSLITAFITGAIDTACGCQRVGMYPQLIIKTAINHLARFITQHTPSVDSRTRRHLFLYFIYTPAETAATEATASCGPCKAISSCSIYPLDWNCVLIREMMGQVFWYGIVSVRNLIPSHSRLRHGGGRRCQTASFVRLLIGVIYCPNRQSSCGFTA